LEGELVKILCFCIAKKDTNRRNFLKQRLVVFDRQFCITMPLETVMNIWPVLKSHHSICMISAIVVYMQRSPSQDYSGHLTPPHQASGHLSPGHQASGHLSPGHQAPVHRSPGQPWHDTMTQSWSETSHHSAEYLSDDADDDMVVGNVLPGT